MEDCNHNFHIRSIYSVMKTSRLDWTIVKSGSSWTATYKPDGTVLTAKTKKALMPEIIKFEQQL